MTTSTLTESHGCASVACQCAGSSVPSTLAHINGVALQALGEALSPEALRERAYTELLRQEAVRQGQLAATDATLVAPELDEAERLVIESMLDAAVQTPSPSAEACQRYYEANKPHFVVGQALQVRHILFAVTPGVNVQALAQRAEAALLELLHKEAPPQRFEALARELSNCPTGAQGGDLGWVGPDDCAPELANAFFFQHDAGWSVGIHPRLVHTRYGLHIMEVLDQRKGQQLALDEVHDRIAKRLALTSRATALRQYMLLLVGQADVGGVELEGADSPLVQ